MPVYLIRHAEAVDERRDLPDGARHLTAVGRAQAKALGDRLRWHDGSATRVWTSPLVRAVQTAELVLATLGEPVEVEVDVRLAPDGDLAGLARSLAALPAAEGTLVFGHEPGLSALLARLIGAPEAVALARAEAVRVDAGVVRWRFAHDDDAPRR